MIQFKRLATTLTICIGFLHQLSAQEWMKGVLILKNVDIFKNQEIPNAETLIQNNGQLLIRGNSNILKE